MKVNTGAPNWDKDGGPGINRGRSWRVSHCFFVSSAQRNNFDSPYQHHPPPCPPLNRESCVNLANNSDFKVSYWVEQVGYSEYLSYDRTHSRQQLRESGGGHAGCSMLARRSLDYTTPASLYKIRDGGLHRVLAGPGSPSRSKKPREMFVLLAESRKAWWCILHGSVCCL